MPQGHTAPTRITPQSLDDYLEVMSKAVFQSGISWRVVEGKWPGITEAFHDFNVGAVAAMDESDVDALATDTRVIRNRRKLQGIVHNARTMIELDDEHGSFQTYLRSHDDFWTLLGDLRARFKFMGNMGTYYWLYVVGEDVPPYEEFQARTQK